MPTHLVSLKRSASDSDNFLDQPEQDRFPVGLHISDEEVAALGIGDLSVGDTRLLIARVKVTSVSQHEREGGEASRSVSFDLTEASVDPDPDQESQVADRLFPGDA